MHCAELCGIFHGAMTNAGQVKTPAQFLAWATTTQARLADVTRILPPYATVYDPTVVPNIGKALVKLGHHRCERLLLPAAGPVPAMIPADPHHSCGPSPQGRHPAISSMKR